MTGRARRTFAASSAMIAVALTLAPAFAQTSPDAVGVEIGPATVERDLPGRSVLMQFLVVNHEPTPRRIAMSISGLGHDLEGTPQFLEPAKATGSLRLNATSFTLAPDARRTLTVTGAIPESDRSLYAAVIAEFTPLQPTTGTVETRSRVASLVLLRAPKPWQETVSVEDVGLLPDPQKPGIARVFAAVKNTGNVHVRPGGTARIYKGSTLLATVQLDKKLIIPGFARRLSASWKPPKNLTGSIRIDVSLTNPAARGSGTGTFSKGTVERPQARINNLRAYDQGGAFVTMAIANIGRIPIAPTAVLFITQDGIERARTILAQDTIPPGRSVDVEWRPTLDDGVYVVNAQVKLGDVLLDQTATGLRLGFAGEEKVPGNSARRRTLLIVAIVLLIVAFFLLFLAWRRRRDEEDSERVPPPDPGRELTAARRGRLG